MDSCQTWVTTVPKGVKEVHIMCPYWNLLELIQLCDAGFRSGMQMLLMLPIFNNSTDVSYYALSEYFHLELL